MSSATGIEWTDRVWNPVVGCSPVSPGCLNCYAARMAVRIEGMGVKGYKPILPASQGRGARAGRPEERNDPRAVRIAEVRGGRPVFTGSVRFRTDKLLEPLSWRRPARVFVNSMSDLFHEAVPFEFIDRVFAVMALCPQLTFQVLTKRPERMAEYFSAGAAALVDRVLGRARDAVVEAASPDVKLAAWVQNIASAREPIKWPLENVWLGTSVEDQPRADDRIPHLLRCPAAVRFLSCEPLLGPIDLRAKCPPNYAAHLRHDRISWVIVGGESGPGARACDVAWVQSVVGQCRAAGVPVFVKQLGANVLCDCGSDVGSFAKNHGHKRVSCARCGMYLPLRSRKGADMTEWPEDLRVREMPEVRA